MMTQCHIFSFNFAGGWHPNGRLPTLCWPRVRWALKRILNFSRLETAPRIGTRFRMAVFAAIRVQRGQLARRDSQVLLVLQVRCRLVQTSHRVTVFQRRSPLRMGRQRFSPLTRHMLSSVRILRMEGLRL